ncbi:MAG: methionyl-tRNA formyltransferase [Armatimonadetes bacterium]|nr:methionyl-tRNA formyltransferase [Armatimonadota bacterium]
MRLVFFGTSPFAVPALRAVAPDVVLVVTQPDRPAGRGRKLRATPVKEAAEELGLPVVAPERARNKEFVSSIRQLDADALLLAAYGQILPESLLGAARRGGINLHASALPYYRGAAPIQRALLAGETETGVTLMQMDKGMDTGDIIAIERLVIGPDETAGELEARLGEVAARMAKEWMRRIAAGDYPRTPQEHDNATLAPKMGRGEGELRFEMSAEEAYRRFRACTPRPGVSLATRFGGLRVRSARLDLSVSAQAGVAASVGDEGLTVGFADGGLRLKHVQLEGRKQVSGLDFANGVRLRPGDSLA